MGVADRDWYREDPPQGEQRRPWSYALPLIALAVVAVGFVGRSMHHAAPADPEHVVHHDESLSVGPGLSIPIHRDPLYATNDPWKPYLADEQTCPNAEDVNAPLHEQALTMICLINHARLVRGLTELPVSPQLSVAVQLKGSEIARCKVFAHAPCGGDARDVALQAGFDGAWGENLFIADGRYGAPRPALDGWLNSPGHRENLFRPEWQIQSVYVAKLGSFPGFTSPTLWVSEFGG